MSVGDWTTGYHSEPDGATDPGSVLDDELQTLKALIRERAAIEHDWGTSSFSGGFQDSGRHTNGSARAFAQNTAPTTLLKPDGTAGNTLTSALDGGRLWIDTNQHNRGYVLDPDVASVTFNPIVGMPICAASVNSTSTSSATIDNVSYTSLTFGTNSLTIPSNELTWLLTITMTILVSNGAGSDRSVRADLYETGVGATLISSGATFKAGAAGEINLRYSVSIATASTYTIEARCQSSGGSVTFNGGAHSLTANGAANRSHVLHMRAVPYPLT